MTTYLGSAVLSDRLDDTNDMPIDFIAYPYCSRNCLVQGPRDRSNGTVIQQIENYEFDETCANCGVLIPATD